MSARRHQGTTTMKHLIAVINQKGGVGKTTTSINFAAGLALRGDRVLLVDLDPQAHSTIGVGIEPGSFQASIGDVLAKKKTIQEIVLPTNVDGLFIAPAHIRLDKIEQQLNTEFFRESFLKRALAGLGYDHIVIDCRPTLGTLTINALYASSFIVVPCEMGRYALDGFADLMETIEHVKGNNGPKEGFIRILLTKYDSRNKVSNDWVFQQLEPYKSLIFQTSIRRNEALNQAQMAQEPIFSFKSDCSGAQDYKALVEEFSNLWQNQTSEKN
jgi:chromosome partitioning protein